MSEKNFCKITNKECEYCNYFRCELLDTVNLEMCLKDILLPETLEPNSLQSFIVTRHPYEVLSWLSYKRRNHIPNVKDLVLTLTGGFATTRPGKILRVREITNTTVFLNDDGHSAGGRGYGVKKTEWWRKLFVLP